MRSPATSVLFAVALSCQWLSAQITVSVDALTPISVTATDGAASLTTTLPAGPLSPQWFEVESDLAALGTSAVVGGSTATTNNEAYCSIGFGCVNGSPTAVTATNTVESLVTFSAPVPTPVRFLLELHSVLPAGATVPVVEVDVDNDGTIDYAHGVWQTFLGSRTIGPGGIQFRVILQGGLQQQGSMFEDLLLRVMPNNNTSIFTSAVGCVGTGPGVYESFLDTGVSIRNDIPSSYPRVFVFGLDTQPVILPTVSQVPCLLLPRLDLVMAIGGFSGVELALPASVRPATFWVQNVELHGSDLFTGYCSQVTAN